MLKQFCFRPNRKPDILFTVYTPEREKEQRHQILETKVEEQLFDQTKKSRRTARYVTMHCSPCASYPGRALYTEPAGSSACRNSEQSWLGISIACTLCCPMTARSRPPRTGPSFWSRTSPMILILTQDKNRYSKINSSYRKGNGRDLIMFMTLFPR